MAHRAARKTTAATEVGTVWWILFHPDARIALLRDTHGAAADTLATIAQYIEMEPIQALFHDIHGKYPHLDVHRADRLTFNFKGSVTKEGSIDSFGHDTVPTGSHYDKVIADDVCTIRDRFSRAKRERTKANVQEIMTNILDAGCQMHVVGTPWHKEDIWSLPGMPKPKIYDVYSSGVFTPSQIEEKRRTTTPAMFALNYELRHTREGMAIFGEPNTMEPWDYRRIVGAQAHVDARFNGGHYTACTIMGERPDGRWATWVKVYDNHVKDVVDDILKEMQKRDAAILYVEDNPDKGWTADLFRAGGSGLYRIPSVIDYHETTNKQHKIEGYVSQYWDRLVFAEDCEETALEQICDYAGEEPDDAPDSLASLIRQGFHQSRGSDVLNKL